jgi:DNA-binding transcriptional LysR family regulator
LADNGVPATVVGEAAYLAGVLNAARGGLGVALVAGIARPEGLEPCTELPPVAAERLHLRVRPGSDPRLRDTAAEALRAVLAQPSSASTPAM